MATEIERELADLRTRLRNAGIRVYYDCNRSSARYARPCDGCDCEPLILRDDDPPASAQPPGGVQDTPAREVRDVLERALHEAGRLAVLGIGRTDANCEDLLRGVLDVTTQALQTISAPSRRPAREEWQGWNGTSDGDMGYWVPLDADQATLYQQRGARVRRREVFETDWVDVPAPAPASGEETTDA